MSEWKPTRGHGSSQCQLWKNQSTCHGGGGKSDHEALKKKPVERESLVDQYLKTKPGSREALLLLARARGL